MESRAFTFVLTALAFGAFVYGQTQKTFDSPEAAAQALIDATTHNDTAALAALFGPNGHQILTSGNPQQDQTERQEFAQSAARKHQLEPSTLNRNVMILVVGNQDWPFPVPIVRTNGKWSFDTAQGAIEMQARKIGADELDAIEICSGYVDAQQAYAAQDRNNDGILEYAQRIMSSPGSTTDCIGQETPSPWFPSGLRKRTLKAELQPHPSLITATIFMCSKRRARKRLKANTAMS